MCYGSDLLGDMHCHQSKEFDMRAKVLPLPEVIRHATINTARLFGMEGQIGCISSGADADLILVEGNPLKDMTVLSAPDGKYVRVVIKDGLVAKGPTGLGSVNDIVSRHTKIEPSNVVHGLKRKASH
eukprot:gene22470-29589_t